MSVKDKVLEYFENNKERNISGEELAKSLSVSRNSVWKAVKTLQEEGHKITAVTNRGYRMSENSDILTEQSITKYLNNSKNFYHIEIIENATSTNNVLKKYTAGGETEGKVIIAKEQSGGKGRLGRSFFSPPGTGLYMSILLRPAITADKALFITTTAAVSVAEAIEKVSGKQTGIKWVNDVFLDGKKICGILTEASVGMEDGMLEHAILGVGINIQPPENGYPEELKDIIGTVFTREEYCADSKSRIAAAVLESFYRYYTDSNKKAFIGEYKKRSILNEKELIITRNGKEEKVTAKSIDDECRLIVENENGQEEALVSGEVSIKKQ